MQDSAHSYIAELDSEPTLDGPFTSYDHAFQPADVTDQTAALPVSLLATCTDPNVDLEDLEGEQGQRIARLALDMAENGLREPVVVASLPQGGTIILDGHHRLIAAQWLGWDALPAVGRNRQDSNETWWQPEVGGLN